MLNIWAQFGLCDAMIEDSTIHESVITNENIQELKQVILTRIIEIVRE